MECVQLTLDDWIQMKQRLRQELLGGKAEFREDRLCAETD